MFRIGKKKKVKKEDISASEDNSAQQSEKSGDTLYAGTYSGHPWKKISELQYRPKRAIKNLSKEEQSTIIEIAKKYFLFSGKLFAQARKQIQEFLDNSEHEATITFFSTADFNEKRLALRAYLSNADGRFISQKSAIDLIQRIAFVGLDFEVGIIINYIDEEFKAEIIVGDATEIVSKNGYWFAHTHPVKKDFTINILPSKQDIDVILLTARAYAQHLAIFKTDYYVLRDIGMSKVHVNTYMKKEECIPEIVKVSIEYNLEDENIIKHANDLRLYLRMKHHLKENQITINSVDQIAFSG